MPVGVRMGYRNRNVEITRLRRAWDEGWEEPEPTPAGIDAQPGMVLRVPNKLWGFDTVRNDEHPGVVSGRPFRARLIPLHKGVSYKARGKYGGAYVVVAPSRQNGLRNPTMFDREPTELHDNRVRELLMDGARGLGWLETEKCAELWGVGS